MTEAEVLPRFPDRADAGRQLAERLAGWEADVVVAIPNGGIAVAVPIAEALGLPLKVAWADPELFHDGPAAGYRARERMRSRMGERSMFSTWDDPVSHDPVHEEFASRDAHFPHPASIPDVAGQRVIMVDDGLVPDGELLATARGLRRGEAARVTMATPFIESAIVGLARHEVDEIVTLEVPLELDQAGRWYFDADEPTDEQVSQEISLHG